LHHELTRIAGEIVGANFSTSHDTLALSLHMVAVFFPELLNKQFDAPVPRFVFAVCSLTAPPYSWRRRNKIHLAHMYLNFAPFYFAFSFCKIYLPLHFFFLPQSKNGAAIFNKTPQTPNII
jgi:hypothetical protein